MLWYLSSGRRLTLSQTAKLFINGRSQAVRLPAAFRFDTVEVFIRQDPKTGDVPATAQMTVEGVVTLNVGGIPTGIPTVNIRSL